MGILSSISGIKDDLFGDDSETTTSTGPTSGTKTTTDSGQVVGTDSTTSNTGQTTTSTSNQNQVTGSTGSTSQNTNTSQSNQSSSSGFTSNLSNVSQGTKSNQTSTSESTTATSGRTDTSSSTTSGRTDTQVIGGSTTTTSRGDQVNTSQLMLTQEAVDYLVKGILESNAGLASLTGAPKGAGIYDATTTQMLASDLVARTAGEVAARSAVTKQVIGGVTETTKESGRTITSNIGAQTTTGVQSIGAQTSTTSGTTQTIGESQTTGKSYTAGTSSGTETSTGTGTSATTGTSDNKGYTSSSGVVEAIVGPSSSTTKGTQTTGPRTIQEVANTSGSKTNTEKDDKGLLDWIVCTELHKQKRMSNYRYLCGGRKFLTYDSRVLKGYYIWAEPSVKHLRKHPQSIYSKFLAHIFNHRAQAYTAKPTIYSKIIAASVYIVCWTLSRTVARTHKYVREVSYG